MSQTTQTILTYVVLGFAILFLFRKFIFKSKKKNDCDTDCNC